MTGDVRLEPLRPEHVRAAATMLAGAFLTNPLHVAAFGESPFEKNERFFRAGLAVMKGSTFVAVEGSRLLGLVHWARAPECQLSAIEKLQIMPVMIGFGILTGLGIVFVREKTSQSRSGVVSFSTRRCSSRCRAC